MQTENLRKDAVAYSNSSSFIVLYACSTRIIVPSTLSEVTCATLTRIAIKNAYWDSVLKCNKFVCRIKAQLVFSNNKRKMADYWKSNQRKYCEYCQCWLSDNKPSISFHENGKRHKMNVEKRITNISRNSEKAERERQKMDIEMRKMEDAAMKAYALDMHARRDMTARTVHAVMDAGMVVTDTGSITTMPSAVSSRPRQVDPLRLPGNSDDEDDDKRVSVLKVAPEIVPDASLWVEGKSEEGHTYYWNVKTNESVWKPPKEGYLSWKEYQRINDLALKQQNFKEAEDAKKFREGANEEVARYNRERLKAFRKPETPAEKQTREEEKAQFRTEADASGGQMGTWQTVEYKPPPKPVDLQLPKSNKQIYIPPIVLNSKPSEPPVKRFKEKTIDCLDEEFAGNTSTSFKKRKFTAKGNARTRLDVD